MPCLPAVDSRTLELLSSSAALRVHQFSRRKSIQLLTLLAVVMPVTSPAALTNYVWDGNAPFALGNSRWSYAPNWALNAPPPGTDISGLTNSALIFTGRLKRNPLMNGNYYVHSVEFASTAGDFTLNAMNSGGVISIGTGGILNNSTNRQTILNTLSISNSQTWNAAAGQIAIGGAVNLDTGRVLTVAGANQLSISNVIRGGGALVKEGSGNLLLAGTTANTFSGGLTIQAGTVTVAKNNALGTGPLTVMGGILNLGSYNLGVSSISLQGGTITSSSGGITSSSTYQLQSGTVSTRLGGTGGLSKSTAGTVLLNSANTFAGDTHITGGRLVVNNTSGSATGTGNVSVSGGGLLMGSGLITGNVTNASGGAISAGNEVGVLNLGNMIWFGGATNRWDLANAAGTAGVGWDLLNIAGTLTINATALDKAIIDVVSFTLGGVPGLTANFDSTQNYSWTILQTTGGILFAPGESAETVFDLFTGNFINPQTGGLFGIELSTDGRSLSISYTVPEPDTLVVAGLAACGLIYGRRFRQNWLSAKR